MLIEAGDLFSNGWNGVFAAFDSGKCVSDLPLGVGRVFPTGLQAETAFQNLAPEWDAVSGAALKRKLHPRIPLQNGMRFPNGAACGNCLPDSSLRMGFIFQQMPGAESSSQNPGNSVIRWLSERYAKDAKRKT